ncbi:MAG: hypothetical protein VZR95_09315 [Alphaproteobacteria bacterium]
MLQSPYGKVFLYNDNKFALGAFDDFFTSRSLKMFGSDNLYQLIRYAKEINPDLLIFNLQEQPEPDFSPLRHFCNEISSVSYPIIVLQNETDPFPLHPNIAHYLRLPHHMQRLVDITESYGLGHKNHQILLLDTYQEADDTLHNYLKKENLTYFEVHNARAAEFYLQKNKPQIFCIEPNSAYAAIINKHPHDKLFYVDRDKDITEIRNFLH